MISADSFENRKRSGFHSREVKFAVEEAFRGVNSTGISVFTGWGGGDCGSNFLIGVQYLVYAYEDNENKRLVTNICTRTRALTDAAEDLSYLRNLASAPIGSLIFGQVNVSKKYGERSQPMESVRINIEGGDKKSEASTDQNGQFSFKGLPAGSYKVSIVLPDGLTAGRHETTVTVEEKGCASVYFYVSSDGRLSGQIVNTMGQPIAKAELWVMTEGKKRYEGYFDHKLSDEKGMYQFNQIPPGRYIVQIRYDGLSSQTRPFPVVYLPGVSDRPSATVIEFKEGQEIKDHKIIAPDLPAERSIEAVVVSSDGSVVTDAKVNYRNESTVYNAPSVSPGRFIFKLYEGVGVVVVAHVERNGKLLQSQPIEIPRLGDPGKITLTIQGL